MGNLSKKLWAEDDCLRNDPDHETIEKAYARLIGGDFKTAMEGADKDDQGDQFLYTLTNGLVVVHAYDGWSIYRGTYVGKLPRARHTKSGAD